MSAIQLPNVKTWLAEPMPKEVARAIERLARSPDVLHMAVMPDVHLAQDVCVGTTLATGELIYPAAVGSDIGCGIAAVAFNATADVIDASVAKELLQRLRTGVPVHRRRERHMPRELLESALSEPALERLRAREGSVQFGTLGRGNHFLEFQRDDDGRLWLMVHSGSRAMGPAIRTFHEARGDGVRNALKSIVGRSTEGIAYRSDMEWARAYARANRAAMIDEAGHVLQALTGALPDEQSRFDCDHNHVLLEDHFGSRLWVHRKGAMSAIDGELGAIPGSMGTLSFHVSGRGNAESMHSSSHGAGRAMSRDEARRRVSSSDLRRRMSDVHFDPDLTEELREESPQAYKDVAKVMRAQAELTRVVRRLKPVVVYKGG